MLIYENAWPSTYEEIKTWYPVWYRDVFEMDAIWRVFGMQMDKIQAALIWMVDNNFIDFADAYTVTRLENFLGIVHPFPRTLVERRTILKGFIRSLGKMGRPEIIEIISMFTTGEIDVQFFRPGTISATVTRDFGDMFNLHDIHMILGHRIPAHLSLGVIDLPQPVRAVNHNDFIFIDLLMMHFRFPNITSPRIRLDGERLLDGSWLLGVGIIHGIDFVDFHVRAIVRNYGVIAEGLTLDGSNILDGSFFLNGKKFGPLRGMSPHNLHMGAYKIPNEFSISAGIDFPVIRVVNAEGFRLSVFHVKTRIANSGIVKTGFLLNGQRLLVGTWGLRELEGILNGMTAQRLSAGAYKLQNSSRLSGTLTKTSPWHLDGRLNLDAGLSVGGTQTLSELTIKEEL